MDVCSDPQYILMKARLEEAKGDLEMMATYMKSKDEAFCRYHEDITFDHESLVNFIEEENKKMETSLKKAFEHDTGVEQQDDGFTPVTGRRSRRHRNKKETNQTTVGRIISPVNRFLMGNEENSTDDSVSADTADKDSGESDFHKAET